VTDWIYLLLLFPDPGSKILAKHKATYLINCLLQRSKTQKRAGNISHKKSKQTTLKTYI